MARPDSTLRALATLVVATMVAALAAVGLPLTAAQAAGVPDLRLATSAPAAVLLGAPATYTLTATNPVGPGAAYNVSFRAVLPAGVTYVPASGSPADVGEPVVIADQPAPGQTTLIWRNVADVQVGGSLSLSFRATPDPTAFPVASTFTSTADAFANGKPRVVPTFDPAGNAVPTTVTSSATASGRPTTVSAFVIRKSEPSPEHELLRGVHEHSTVYTLAVDNNATVATDAVTVTDYLPAGLEFLGCGGVDNSADGTVEYADAPRLTVVPGAGAGCLAPDSVDTVLDPVGRPPGVYTQVTWRVGDLGPGAARTITYRAGIPLRANSATFPGEAPAPGGLQQTANLDNNTGPSTAETGTEQALTNHADATGTYTGTVAGGGSATVTSSDQVTVTAEDLAMQKSVSPGTFRAGAIATYTLSLQTGEYRRAAGVVVTDLVPNGVCPLSPTTNFATGSPADCAPGAAFTPTGATIASGTQNADGTFALAFSPVATMTANDTLTIRYSGRMRTTYTGNGGGVVAGSPTVAGDAFTNSVSLDGTSGARPGDDPPDPAPDVTVHDDSSATQTSGGPAIDKQILASATPMDCGTGAYADTPTPPSRPLFHQGDRVCFQLRVDFPAVNQTRSPVITDFLPDGVTYEDASATVGPGNTVPAGQIGFNEAASALETEDPTWAVGGLQGGVRFVAPGSVLVVRFSAVIGVDAVGDEPEVVGNLMKLRSENSLGRAVSRRDQVDFLIAPAPPLQLLKGVASVNGQPAPPSPPNTDGVYVRQGDLVVFRVDVANQGSAAVGNEQTVQSLRVLDALPPGITCLAITEITDSGHCFEAGAAGRPAVNPAAAAVLRWELPATDRIVAGATRPSLAYAMRIPAEASVSTVFTNTAGVSHYDALTNIEDDGVPRTTRYFPTDNIDTSVPQKQQGAPRATDTSDVRLRDVPVTKTGLTSIVELNNNAPSQAVVGELVTYPVTATIPAQSTVYRATLTDPLPAGLTFLGATAGFQAAPSAAVGPLPGTVALNPSTGALTFPTTYNNATATDQVFTVTIVARVNTDPTNTSGRLRTNTATFRSYRAASGGTRLTDRTARHTVTVVAPAPTLVKADSTGTGKLVTANQLITYTLTARNASGRPSLKDSFVVDCVPVGLTFAAYGATAAATLSPAVPGDGANGCAAGTTQLRWTLIASLAAGTPVTVTYTARVNADSAGLQTFTNTATVTGSTLADRVNDPTTERVLSAAATDTVTVRGATLTKAAVPVLPTIGQRVSYTITATLPADVNFYDAALVDALPAGIDPASVQRTAVTCGFVTATGASCLATIPGGGAALTNAPGPAGTTLQGWLLGDVRSNGQVRVLTATYVAVVRDVSGNVRGTALTNSATVRWDLTNRADPTSAGATFDKASPVAAATVTVQEPLLSAAKSVDDTTVEPGQTFTYTVAVTSSGALNVSAAYNAQVRDVVPVGVVLDPATIDGGGVYDPATRTITWTIAGPIAPGATVSRTYSARLAASSGLTTAPLRNTVTIDSYQSLATGGRTYTGPGATASVTPTFPTLTPAKAAVTTGQAFVGERFTWRLTVANPGTARASRVDVVDTLPTHWTYAAGSARAVVAGGAAAAVEPTVTTVAGVVTLTWSDLGDLDQGQTVVVTYDATPTLAATTSPGAGLTVPHVNTVRATWEDATGATGNGSGPYGSGPATATARIAAADVSVTKTHTGSFTAGGNGSWTVVVRNAGPDAATGPFVVRDTLPAGTTLVSATGTGWTCTGTTPIECTRSDPADTLAVATAFPAITVTVAVAATVASGATLTNGVTVTARTVDPQPGNNSATDAVPVIATADLAIAKSHPAGLRPIAGQPFTWTLDVVNRGPSVSRAPITVTDALPAGTAFVEATGTGWSCTAAALVVTCTSGDDLAVGEAAPRIAVTADVPSDRTADLTNIGRVTGTTPDPVPGNDEATDTVPVDRLADLALAKDHVGRLVAGATGTYRFRVENLGPSDAAAPVRFTDALPAGVTATGAIRDVQGAWTCTGRTDLVCTLTGALAAGDLASVEVEVELASGATGNVVNTATVTSPTPDPNPVNNTDSDSSVLDTEADLGVVKSHTGQAVAGRELSFTLAVRNNGPSDSPGPVVVSDGLPRGTSFGSAEGPGWACDADADGVLTCTRAAGLPARTDAPGITLVVHVDPDAGPGTLVNTATVRGPLLDPVPGNDSSTDTVTVVDLANVSLTKRVTSPTPPAPVRAGEPITYQLHVTNDGPSVADQVTVSDPVPSGTVLVSADGAGWACSGDTVVRCLRPTLTASTSSDVTVVVRVASDRPGGSTVTNVARVDTTTPGDDPDDNQDTATTDVVVEADLRLAKTHRGDGAVAGRTVTYDLVVTNAGPSDAQRPITVTDRLPAGLSYVSAQGPWDCTAPDPRPTGQPVTCTLQGTVALGAGADAPTLTLVVQVAADVAPGAFANTAAVEAPTTDPLPGNNGAGDTVDVRAVVDLAVTKAHAGPVRIGDPVTFLLSVRNAGPSAATRVVLTDTAPAGLIPADQQPSTGWTCTVAGPAVSCRLDGPLAAGAAAAPLTLTYTVTAAAYPSATNRVEVTSDGTEATPADNTATDVVSVPPEVDLSVTKAHEAALAVGSRATYLLTVGNAGPTDDPGPVTVTDRLPAGLRYVDASGAGWSCAAPDGQVTCTAARGLASGASATLRVTVDVLPAAYPSVSNTASVATPATDRDPGNNTATDTAPVQALVDLSIRKRVQSSGDRLARWTIRVTNRGPNEAAQAFTVTDTLPAGLDLVRVGGQGWTCDTGGRVISCTYSRTLAAGASTDLVIVSRVRLDAGTSVTNTAVVASPQDSDDSNNRDSATLDIATGVLGERTGPNGGGPAPGGTGGSGPSGGPLPHTGADVAGLLGVGVLLLLTGAGVLRVGRRRPGGG